MQQDWLVKRVELLELAMDGLTGLPEAVGRLDRRVAALEQQFLQHRIEVRGEFSSVRSEMRGLTEETRAEMRQLNEETQAEMRQLNDETRAEMRQLNDETTAQMRMLHEEVLSRITTRGEASRTTPARRRRKQS